MPFFQRLLPFVLALSSIPALANDDGKALSVGTTAPAFMLPVVNSGFKDAKRFGPNKWVGPDATGSKKIVILSFFATYCGPCKKEMPELVRLYDKYKDQGLGVMLVSIDKGKEKAAEVIALANGNKANFPVMHDRFQVVARRYGAERLPYMLMLGKDGKVKVVHVGYTEALKAGLENEIRAQLGLPAIKTNVVAVATAPTQPSADTTDTKAAGKPVSVARSSSEQAAAKTKSAGVRYAPPADEPCATTKARLENALKIVGECGFIDVADYLTPSSNGKELAEALAAGDTDPHLLTHPAVHQCTERLKALVAGASPTSVALASLSQCAEATSPEALITSVCPPTTAVNLSLAQGPVFQKADANPDLLKSMKVCSKGLSSLKGQVKKLKKLKGKRAAAYAGFALKSKLTACHKALKKYGKKASRQLKKRATAEKKKQKAAKKSEANAKKYSFSARIARCAKHKKAKDLTKDLCANAHSKSGDFSTCGETQKALQVVLKPTLDAGAVDSSGKVLKSEGLDASTLAAAKCQAVLTKEAKSVRKSMAKLQKKYLAQDARVARCASADDPAQVVTALCETKSGALDAAQCAQSGSVHDAAFAALLKKKKVDKAGTITSKKLNLKEKMVAGCFSTITAHKDAISGLVDTLAADDKKADDKKADDKKADAKKTTR